MAALALLGIVISVIGTGLLYLMQPKQPTSKQSYSQEEIQKMIDSGKIQVKTADGKPANIEVKTQTASETPKSETKTEAKTDANPKVKSEEK